MFTVHTIDAGDKPNSKCRTGLTTWQLSAVPASAEGLDEQDAGGHAAGHQVSGGALVGQLNALRGEDFEIGGGSPFVARGGEVDRLAGVGDGRLLRD